MLEEPGRLQVQWAAAKTTAPAHGPGVVYLQAVSTSPLYQKETPPSWACHRLDFTKPVLSMSLPGLVGIIRYTLCHSRAFPFMFIKRYTK